jgi:(E)-4-hydroxy-3-methylbut-2-enyl-diphosphate synthase
MNDLPPRKETREVMIGDVGVGGDNPIRVQSMTMGKTDDIQGTIQEIRELEEAGCELARVAVPDEEAAESLGVIKQNINIPLIADIHFHHYLGLMAIEQGVDKVRINPGNIQSKERAEEVVKAAKDAGIAMRIGVNSGSLDERLLEKYDYPCADALVESALEYCDFVESLGFHDIIVSMKSSTPATAYKAYRQFSEQSDIPLHLGVTEAGSRPDGSIKTAVGLGGLLIDGIGDTIRVSLTDDAVEEIPVAYKILQFSGRRVTEPDIVACPTCGRIEIDLEEVVAEVEERIGDTDLPVRISVLGCVVNGPGEAREADIGIAGGKGVGMLFRDGETIRKVDEDEMVDALVEEVERIEAEREEEGEEADSELKGEEAVST